MGKLGHRLVGLELEKSGVIAVPHSLCKTKAILRTLSRKTPDLFKRIETNLSCRLAVEGPSVLLDAVDSRSILTATQLNSYGSDDPNLTGEPTLNDRHGMAETFKRSIQGIGPLVAGLDGPELPGSSTPRFRPKPRPVPELDMSSQFLSSRDESGTASEDRSFRPDVEGLRALAVLLVVLYHAGVPALTGGFVGVDVFFVISGFVITGLLLRERFATGKTQLLKFYGRRSRRILPAATLVIALTLLASYHWLGFIVGDQTANFGMSADLFYSNFHLIASGTSYLSSQQEPSPLQNFWSLSVEEQFYVFYPTLFILTAIFWKRISTRLKLSALLTGGIIASLTWSILQTSSNSVAAYFSPFTRGWELALGGLIAVSSLHLRNLPPFFASSITWIGLGGVLFAALAYTSSTPYPGIAVALPVVSAGLVVAGGAARPKLGAEALLGFSPVQLLGKLSYSLYLLHWPILIIAAEYAGHSLPLRTNLGLVLIALAVSIACYFAVENPLRRWQYLARSGWRSLALGAVLVCLTLSIIAFEIAHHP